MKKALNKRVGKLIKCRHRGAREVLVEKNSITIMGLPDSRHGKTHPSLSPLMVELRLCDIECITAELRDDTVSVVAVEDAYVEKLYIHMKSGSCIELESTMFDVDLVAKMLDEHFSK